MDMMTELVWRVDSTQRAIQANLGCILFRRKLRKLLTKHGKAEMHRGNRTMNNLLFNQEPLSLVLIGL